MRQCGDIRKSLKQYFVGMSALNCITRATCQTLPSPACVIFSLEQTFFSPVVLVVSVDVCSRMTSLKATLLWWRTAFLLDDGLWTIPTVNCGVKRNRRRIRCTRNYIRKDDVIAVKISTSFIWTTETQLMFRKSVLRSL